MLRKNKQHLCNEFTPDVLSLCSPNVFDMFQADLFKTRNKHSSPSRINVKLAGASTAELMSGHGLSHTNSQTTDTEQVEMFCGRAAGDENLLWIAHEDYLLD